LGEVILNANNIYKSYYNGIDELMVLQNFKLKVHKSEIVTIMGQSGSGKSTALNILGSLDKPNSGTVEIAGVNVYDLDENGLSLMRNQEVGFVFQFHHLLPEFTAIENVLVPTWIRGKENMKSQALHFFELLNLSNVINHLPGQLSGGERSRVALIRGIINQPKILFADEPTGNLDEKNAIKLIDLLGIINKDFNQAIVLTTHNPDVASLGNRQYKLEKGILHIRN